MEYFVKVIKKDSQVRIKINILLDRYNRLSYSSQAKIRYDSLIQEVILKDLINILSTILTDIDKELKMKISRNKYLGSKNIYNYKYTLV